jgi:CO/xanthine dehydrogenase Mo-binding subunit
LWAAVWSRLVPLRVPDGPDERGMHGLLARSCARRFLATSAAIGGGLVIAFAIPPAKSFALGPEHEAASFAPNAFLRIGSDDSITVLIAHSEMGQGVWTALPMLLAEELHADWSRIRVEHAPAAPEYANPAFGVQMTGGSHVDMVRVRSVPPGRCSCA